MEMMKKIANFIENYNGAFFVGSLGQNTIIYINKKAKSLFGVTEDDCNFSEILGVNDNRIREVMEFTLETGKNSMIYNHVVRKSTGEKIVVDIQVGYFDEDNTEVFLEIIPQNDTRMQMAYQQIDNSNRPEALLNLDENLSIIHCNDAFHNVFDSNETLRHSHFKNYLVNGFAPEIREKLIKDIQDTLQVSPTFSTKIKVFSATDEEYWYLFELEKRTLDNSGEDKVLAYMSNIEKQVELEENYEILHQFFEATQNLTDEILYRIDLKNKTLHHLLNLKSLNEKLRRLGNKIPNYIEVLMKENIIHPDDHEKYRKFNDEYVYNKSSECDIRFSVYDDNYQYYRMKCNNIYDENNKLTHIIGTLSNITEH